MKFNRRNNYRLYQAVIKNDIDQALSIINSYKTKLTLIDKQEEL